MPATRRPTAIVVGVLATLLLLVGCTDGPRPQTARPDVTARPSPADTAAALPTVGSYVSLGDSFTSGPGLANLQDGAGLCLRSDHNWPSLLADLLQASRFDDVSCAGARTRDIRQPAAGLTGARPQIAAVTGSTDLVTVGIGGNDGGLFSSLIGACTRANDTCASFARDGAPAILARTVRDVEASLDAIKAIAPDATVVLVGYLRIMPETGTCRSIDIPSADAAALVATEEALDRSLSVAARGADVTFVSLRAASRGHDACAGSRAWTNGAAPTGRDGIAFHPRLAGMRAVARAVADAL
ncbi:GDSL-type esterase/lipase family protein [Aeromicrobium sp.]|uniref:SGNH/GDSL hydrolase family protein n=1 Tax=Aeromicrobium sp. TaxID=1871063 RepID=UPI003C371867